MNDEFLLLIERLLTELAFVGLDILMDHFMSLKIAGIVKVLKTLFTFVNRPMFGMKFQVKLKSSQVLVFSIANCTLIFIVDWIYRDVMFLILFRFTAWHWTLAESVFMVPQLGHVGEATIAVNTPINVKEKSENFQNDNKKKHHSLDRCFQIVAFIKMIVQATLRRVPLIALVTPKSFIHQMQFHMTP